METDIQKIRTNIDTAKRFWNPRNLKFKDWFELLVLVDMLQTKGMETYVSNEPQTFYNMAHYLLTKGEISHLASVANASAIELDKKARLHRACSYMWKYRDRIRQLSGEMPFIDELSFYMLVLGWYSLVLYFDSSDGTVIPQLWNPYDVYPTYSNGGLLSCVHSYSLTIAEAKAKAEKNKWDYQVSGTPTGTVTLDDYYYHDKDMLYSRVFINNDDVTGWVERPEMELLVSPIGGFPDRGSLGISRRVQSSVTSTGTTMSYDWRRLAGRGIFEVNEQVLMSFNKWKSIVSQILRDSSFPITQEFSQTPQASPEQLRDRGAHFHYGTNEKGLERLPPPAIPLEVQSHLLDMRRELQKGGFSDAVYGMVEGQPGYALSLLASSSANQILYPYMDAKHFVISECDRFWLNNVKKGNKVFQVKGKFFEELKPEDIPEDVNVEVESTVATAKDWMERGTIANMLDKHLDADTIVTKIYELDDPGAIKRAKRLDAVMNHPMSIQLELIGAWESYADFLEKTGIKENIKQAARFRRAAKAAEAQLSAPAPGQAPANEMTRVQQQREAGAPEERTRVSPEVSPPEASGFTPAELRRSIGRGNVKALRGV